MVSHLKRMEKNLTNGSVLKNVIVFSLPYLLSYFLQTLYGMADLFIIGQFDGVASTTAVSIGSQLMHMISFLIITIIVNQRGLNDAAAVGIVEKIISFLFLVPSSMLSTVSALGAQNIGANKPERAVQTLKYAIMIAFGFGLVAETTKKFCLTFLKKTNIITDERVANLRKSSFATRFFVQKKEDKLRWQRVTG